MHKGLALVGAYIERAGVTNMSFTLILLALAVQNFFIFRDFLDRGAVNIHSGSTWFDSTKY